MSPSAPPPIGTAWLFPDQEGEAALPNNNGTQTNDPPPCYLCFETPGLGRRSNRVRAGDCRRANRAANQ